MPFFIRASHVLLLASLSACAGRSQGTAPEPASSATVQVENQGFTDMVIYAIRGGQRVRLGLATGNSTKTFAIPAYLMAAGPLRFLADPIGADRAPISEEMSVQRGAQVTLTIPPQ